MFIIYMSYYTQHLIEFYKKKTSQFDKKVQSLIVCIISLMV